MAKIFAVAMAFVFGFTFGWMPVAKASQDAPMVVAEGKSGEEHGKSMEEHGKAGEEHGKSMEAQGKSGDDMGKKMGDSKSKGKGKKKGKAKKAE